MQWPSINSPAGDPPALSPDEAIQAWEDALLRLAIIPPAEWPNRVGIYCPIHHQYEWDADYQDKLMDLLMAWGTSSRRIHTFSCTRNFPDYTFYLIEYNNGQWYLFSLASSFSNGQSTIYSHSVTWPLLVVQKV